MDDQSQQATMPKQSICSCFLSPGQGTMYSDVYAGNQATGVGRCLQLVWLTVHAYAPQNDSKQLTHPQLHAACCSHAKSCRPITCQETCWFMSTCQHLHHNDIFVRCADRHQGGQQMAVSFTESLTVSWWECMRQPDMTGALRKGQSC